MGKQWKQWQTLFLGVPKSLIEGDCSCEIKTLAPWKKSYDQPRQHIKKQRHYFANKGPSSQSYSFSRSHVWMWELEYSLEGLMLKLKFQSFGHLMRRTDSLEKTLMLGKTEAGGEGEDRGWDDWMTSLTQWTWVWVSSRSWWWTGKPDVLQSMGSQRVHGDTTEWLNWTELKGLFMFQNADFL